MINVVICDDFDEARDILKKCIGMLNVNKIKVVGEAKDGNELIDICRELSPDIVISDIDMPQINGIDAAKQIAKFLPNVSFIFITAYSSYAIDSFEVYPVDFLLKPISIEGLEKSIRRIIKIRFNKVNGILSDTINVSFNHETFTISQKDIIFIERAGRKTIIHTNNKTIMVYESLSSIEQRLDPKIFIRIHKSFIINKDVNFTITKTLGRTRKIVFDGYDKTADISRKKITWFEEQLKNNSI